jgi:hypothetical protein
MYKLYYNFYIRYLLTLYTKAKLGLKVLIIVTPLYKFTLHGSYNTINNFLIVLKNLKVRI